MSFQGNIIINPAQRRIHAAALRLFAERDLTQISVSDLAAAAGVARSTIYNNIGRSGQLFDEVAAQLLHEMITRTEQAAYPEDDMAQRLASGIRFFLRRAYEEPLWGRFINRFALSSSSLYALFASVPTRNLEEGVASGRYRLTMEQIPSAVAMIAGSVVANIQLILEGHQTWRALGCHTAELLLTAFGVPSDEAKALANRPLPQISFDDSRTAGVAAP